MSKLCDNTPTKAGFPQDVFTAHPEMRNHKCCRLAGHAEACFFCAPDVQPADPKVEGVVLPDLHPVCALCKGKGSKHQTGFTGKLVEHTCTLCKGKGTVLLCAEELTELLKGVIAQRDAAREDHARAIKSLVEAYEATLAAERARALQQSAT